MVADGLLDTTPDVDIFADGLRPVIPSREPAVRDFLGGTLRPNVDSANGLGSLKGVIPRKLPL